MRYKEGAYRAIQELCAVDSGLGLAQWIITSQNTILKALLFCLEDHPREVSLLVIDDVVLSLNAMFSLCYESTTTSDATKETSRSGLRAVVRTLASHDFDELVVRVGVKRALHDLAVKIYPTSSFRAGSSEAVDPAQGMARLLLPCTSAAATILNEGNDGWKKGHLGERQQQQQQYYQALRRRLAALRSCRCAHYSRLAFWMHLHSCSWCPR